MCKHTFENIELICEIKKSLEILCIILSSMHIPYIVCISLFFFLFMLFLSFADKWWVIVILCLLLCTFGFLGKSLRTSINFVHPKNGQWLCTNVQKMTSWNRAYDQPNVKHLCFTPSGYARLACYSCIIAICQTKCVLLFSNLWYWSEWCTLLVLITCIKISPQK